MAVTWVYTYNQPPHVYNTGTVPSTDLVPSVYPVALDGRPYILDDALVKAGMWKHQSIPLLREQFDVLPTPGEQSVNPAGYWRRAQEDWQLGTGQVHFDRPSSQPERFSSSKNVDPFNQRWELSLLRDPQTFDSATYADADTMAVAGTYLYASQGTKVRRSTMVGNAMADFHDFGSTVAALGSEGYWVYAAVGNEVFRWARDAGAPGAAWASSVTVTELGTVKDRVLGAVGNTVVEFDGTGANTVIYTGPDPQWRAVDFTETEGFIYFIGGSGDKWSIYSIDVLDDGTGLAAPQVAAELPEGEVATALEGYLAFLFVGVDRGVRLGIPNNAGDVTLGSLIETGSQVESFEGQGSIVLFEWENYDTASSGLGAIDLSVFTDPEGLVPAYASSFMVDGATHINSIVRRSDVLYFLAGTVGIVEVAASTPRKASGSFDGGWISWNLPAEDKQLTWIRVDTNGVGQYQIELRVDEGAFETVAVVSEKRNRLPLDRRGVRFEYRITLLDAPADPVGPILYGVGLESYAAVDTTAYITVPLLLAETMNNEGYEWYMGVANEFALLKSLRETRKLTSYQEGSTKYTCIVEDYEWMPDSMIDVGPERGTWQGTMVMNLKVVDYQLGTPVDSLTEIV